MADKNDRLTTGAGAPVADNNHVLTAGPHGPMLMQDVWFQEKLAHFDREVIPERRMHAKGSGAYGTFTVTHDVTQYTRASLFAEVGKKTEVFARFSTVAGERGAADAERDIRGFALKFYTDQGNWDMVGNNTPVFFLRDPLKFPDLNHVVKRNPRTNMHSAKDNWDFWTLLPEALHQITVVMSDSSKLLSFMGHRQIDYSDVRVNEPIPDDVQKMDNDVMVGKEVLKNDENYWQAVRPYKLTEKQHSKQKRQGADRRNHPFSHGRLPALTYPNPPSFAALSWQNQEKHLLWAGITPSFPSQQSFLSYSLGA